MKLVSILISVFYFSINFLHAEETKPSSIRFSGIPALGFGPDTGFGFGVVGSMYVDQETFDPYKMAVNLKVYLTHKGINSHTVAIDRLRAFGWPLRSITRLGFYSTNNQNYCGKGAASNCDMTRARDAANEAGVLGKRREDFIKHYYQNRFMLFFGDQSFRYLLWKDVAKLELMASYRGSYYWHRDFKNKGPYPGSLYEKDFPGFTNGYLSTLELGLMLDKRDIESAPTEGYWLESSIRGGSFLIGSSWDYFGANVAARFYFPFDEDRKLVFASQTTGDLIVGDLPHDAMSRIGGSQALNSYTAIGGQNIGRGIREQGYVGRIKFIEQAEFRYTFWSFMLFKQNFDLNAALMTDLAMTSWDFAGFSNEMRKIYAGFGPGLRIYWNKTFVIRADLGFSPEENFSPKFYLTIGNVF
jgi:outer membrane protein assembly factor BamA